MYRVTLTWRGDNPAQSTSRYDVASPVSAASELMMLHLDELMQTGLESMTVQIVRNDLLRKEAA